MKRPTPSLIWFALTAVAAAFSIQTQAASLKVGNPAPKLQVGKWMQGQPVKSFEPGTVYLIDCWATWCGPCVASIPHIEELHQKYKDKGLVVIGQNVWQNRSGTSDSASVKTDEETVAKFLKKMGTNMTYRVAMDDLGQSNSGAMSEAWLRAAGQDGIPAAFIINKHGRIVWIGHPATLKEKVLEDVLADRFDIEKAETELAQEEKKSKQIDQLGEKLVSSMRDQKWSEAEAAIAEMEKTAPELQTPLSLYRFQILLSRKDFATAYKLADSLSNSNLSDAHLQDSLAWIIVSKKDLDDRNVALAEKIAVRANDAAKGLNPSVLDTLARAQFMNGKKKEAAATERKALEQAPAQAKQPIEKMVKSYEDGQLPSLDEP